MHVAGYETRMVGNDGTATLAPPLGYYTNPPEYSFNDSQRAKLARTSNKAWASAPRVDTVANTVFSAAETLFNPPPAKSVLTRGLQVPTRSSSPTSGYPFPEILQQAGVRRDDWSTFTREVRKHASLSKSQWAVTLAGSSSLALLGAIWMGGFTVIPATVLGHQMRRRKEHLNFTVADDSGALAQCVGRWNRFYFRAKGLAVRVDIPGRSRDMEHMDLSSSKLYKTQQKYGETGYPAWHEDSKSRSKEDRARTKASRKARIVIIPLDHQHKGSLRSTARPAFPGLDGAEDDEVSEDETGVANDDESAVGHLLPKRDPYPNEPKP